MSYEGRICHKCTRPLGIRGCQCAFPVFSSFDVVTDQEADVQRDPVERAVRNSPPPLDDVGDDVSFMRDELVFMNPLQVATEALLADRGATHGQFEDNAAMGQALRYLFRHRGVGWAALTDVQREALDMIAGKISRILSGQGGFADHWDDIAGYAKLALRWKE